MVLVVVDWWSDQRRRSHWIIGGGDIKEDWRSGGWKFPSGAPVGTRKSGRGSRGRSPTEAKA